MTRKNWFDLSKATLKLATLVWLAAHVPIWLLAAWVLWFLVWVWFGEEERADEDIY